MRIGVLRKRSERPDRRSATQNAKEFTSPQILPSRLGNFTIQSSPQEGAMSAKGQKRKSSVRAFEVCLSSESRHKSRHGCTSAYCQKRSSLSSGLLGNATLDRWSLSFCPPIVNLLPGSVGSNCGDTLVQLGQKGSIFPFHNRHRQWRLHEHLLRPRY